MTPDETFKTLTAFIAKNLETDIINVGIKKDGQSPIKDLEKTACSS